jgi:hypothetical protein
MTWQKLQLLLIGVISALIAELNLAVAFSHNSPPIVFKGNGRAQQTKESDVEAAECITENIACINDCEVAAIRRYTDLAVNGRGTKRGLQALSELREMSHRRKGYEFGSSSKAKDGSVIAPYRQLIPPKAVAEFLNQVQTLEDKEWLSTNPDSVDGLPSFHVNLVSQGKAKFPTETTENPTEFQKSLQNMLRIVQPYIYNNLLPEVQTLFNSKRIKISDIFFRRYGEDICGITRNGISAHYDIFSRVTAVIALDNTAEDGRNGLYTNHVSKAGATSNHAALRRFFPLQSGDGVIHTWNILHGVDVEAGLDRTSLIVWFTEDSEEESIAQETKYDDIKSVAPWLLDHKALASNNVAQFVLASAMYIIDETQDESKVRLYLNSAAQGNSFALTRMGGLADEGDLDDKVENDALCILESLRPLSSLPDPIQRFCIDLDKKSALMAMRFWFEGAVRGNPSAQRSLADELMFQATQSAYDEDTYLLAAIFFALAAQQEDDEAFDSLRRVIDADLQHRGVESQEEFLASPVVQVARAAM